MLFSLFLLLSSSAASAGWSSSCPLEAHRARFTVESGMELRTGLSGEGREFLLESARQQVKFLQKSLAESWAADHTHVVYPPALPEITILGEENGPASFAYEVSEIKHPDVKIENAYVRGAILQGSLPKGEPVRKVKFRASWEGIACGKIPAASAATAPLDPYLAFWMAPKKERRLIRWQHSEFVLSPLFDAEYSDIPDPFYAWYFWRPESAGVDAKGRAFRAADYLSGGRNAVSVPVEVKALELVPPLVLGARPEGKIKFTNIYGVIDAKKKIWNPGKTLAEANSWGAVLKVAKREIRARDLDRGSYYALDFLLRLDGVMEVESVRNEGALTSLEGKLRGNGRSARVRFFFGPTDLLVSVKPEHWELSGDALENDDVIVYNGHSGLGENFKLSNIEELGGRKLEPRSSQLLAILSCYSFSYYSDYEKPDQLMVTGNDYTTARGAIGLLRWLGGAGRMELVQPEDFLLLRRAE